MGTKKTRVSDLPVFDMAEHLGSPAAIAEYLNQVMDEGDPAELVHALGVAARAQGMTDVAQKSGLSREALYRALRADASPRFDTIARVCAALGVQLRASAA